MLSSRLRPIVPEPVLPTVGLHLIATNQYIRFLPRMIDSVYKNFFPTMRRHVIIYTDDPSPPLLPDRYKGVTFHIIGISHEPWPYVTLKRFHYFSMCDIPLDYSFYCDVDSVFVGTLHHSLLSEKLLGTMHPGHIGATKEGGLIPGKGTVCTDPTSTAYIPEGENEFYYCGGFFGGPHSKFMELTAQLKERIQTDMDNNVMAEWHDESHLNWYFWKNPPTLLIYPFAVQEGPIFEKTCVMFLDKGAIGGHGAFRTDRPPGLSMSRIGFKRR
uniref:Glycosyltransferase n=1 Tax=viral metagenome TaxID=1070528 RepID=A0A6C0AL36_9ZZZZ